MLICTASCKKWLTVKPNTKATREELLTSEKGFQDALTGVYINMKDPNAYGNHLIFGNIESLTSSWDVQDNSVEFRLGRFMYEDEGVKSALTNIYKQQYKTISRINSILDKIDEQRDAFVTSGAFEMIKGECLALRAYCHLDLLRLFGPVPGNVSGGTVLPYVKTLSSLPNKHLSYEAFKTELLHDLSEAAALQKDADPFTKYSRANLADPNNGGDYKTDNTYFAFRYMRMNYYAVKALQARAYCWFQDYAAAFASAKEVIDAKNPDGSAKFRLGEMSDLSGKNFNLTPEQIFGLYDFNLRKKYDDNFKSGKLKKGTDANIVKYQLFGNTGKDIRESSIWQEIATPDSKTAFTLRKYEAAANYLVADPYLIPMLRLSEMYLIAAEAAPEADRQPYWDEFMRARNMEGDIPFPSDQLSQKLALMKEYRKEFFGEGQSFFTYKRMNADPGSFLWLPLAVNINYVPPVPAAESAH
nr:RagB/SusD family nutrient uptake outer membrane protein [Pseudoflavitalea sp. G-6-1-2]